MVILDKLCAKTAQDIIDGRNGADPKVIDGFTTKALGVLQEQGVYASVLFLFSRFGSQAEGNVARLLMTHLLRLLGESDLRGLGANYPNVTAEDITSNWVQTNQQNVLRHFAEGVNRQNGIATNLQRLLAVKSLFEQTLIYVRYGAKAL
jgi:hypothetical protein